MTTYHDTTYEISLTKAELDALLHAIRDDQASVIGYAVNDGSGDTLEFLGRKILVAAQEAGVDRDLLCETFGIDYDDVREFMDDDPASGAEAWPDY